MNAVDRRATATEWELRARSLGADPRAVLFKSFPPCLNHYLHDWHVAEASRTLNELTTRTSARVLDVGCGYGRVSQALQLKHPGVQLIGIDLAPTFARLYRQETGGAAIVNDLDGLPLRAATCDLVLLVTTLMYLSAVRRTQLLSECLRVLKPNGRLLIIEASREGQRVYSGFGLLTRLATVLGIVDTSLQTGGHMFGYAEIDHLVQAAGGRVIRRSGAVRFTILLPLLLVLCRLGGERLAARLLNWCTPSIGATRYAVHICYEVQRAPVGGEV